MSNRNAYRGMNIETLFKNSIGDHASILSAISQKFSIEGRFLNAIKSGIHGEKADVKLAFACGHNIDVNIKSYKNNTGFNQLTRTTVYKFCERFNIQSQQEELENIIIAKSLNTKNALFTEAYADKWLDFFNLHAMDILKWGFSYKQSREIIALFNSDTNLFKIYPMSDCLKHMARNNQVTLTQGGVDIGNCVSFQRKGGNGSLSKAIAKDDIKHPGNNIQLKIKNN